MGVYFGATEITGLYFGGTEITGLYFGDTEIWAAWATYDGTLPAQYSANGDYLADYRIYGSAGGVGDETVNLFDKDITEGIENNYYIDKTTGNKVSNVQYYVSAPITVTTEETYCWVFHITSGGTYHSAPTVGFFDANDNQIGVASHGNGISAFFFTTPANCAYIKASVYKADVDKSMLTPSSTAPASYVPYGYEVDMVANTANLLDCESGWQARLGGGTATGDNVTGTLTISAQYWFQKIFEVKPNTMYTLHGISDSHTITVGYGVAGVQNDAPDLSDQIFWVYSSNITRSFNTGARNKIAILLNCGTSEVGETNYTELQLEENDSFLGFVPYSSTTTPIYIGSDPLGEDEYVDYGDGKIYRAINIFDKESQGIQLGKAIDRDGNLVDDPTAAVSGLIDISGFSDLYIKGVSSGNVIVRYILYTGASSYIWRIIGDESAHVETDGADHIRITVLQSCLDTALISPYSTPQSQDPPVPLPALPTVDGTNIVDYAGQSVAPSRFYAKYRKEGF